MMLYCAAVLETLRGRKDDGQGLVEYGLIITLVSIAAIAALTALGGGVNSILGTITSSL